MQENPVITFDCEWAPDFVLEDVSSILIDNNVKATWFVTNESPIIKKIGKNSLFELGIHPNFFPGSSHGKTIDEVLTNMKKIVPHAKSIRTHRLIQSSPMLKKFQEYGIENDVSILLPNTINIVPHFFKHYNLYRFPFFWEDDVELAENKITTFYESIFSNNGMKILNFHPIHIYLNSINSLNYNKMQKHVGLEQLNKSNAKEFINKGFGEMEVFKKIILSLHDNESNTIQNLRKKYKKIFEG